MSKLYKDRIVNTPDGDPRFTITLPDGTVWVDAKIEMTSEVLQEWDRVGALEFNLIFQRDDDGTVHANFVSLADHCKLNDPIMLSTTNYGTALPSTAEEGRFFFLLEK